jgi:hypothetical protein
MVDCGIDNQTKFTLASLKNHGFFDEGCFLYYRDSRTFRHWGNAAALIRENPEACVYASPIAAQVLIDPDIERKKVAKTNASQDARKNGTHGSSAASQVKVLEDGQEFDLGGW